MFDAETLFAQHKISLTPDRFDLLRRYVAMLLEENTRQNLTAVRTEDEVWARHILDSAMLLRYLPDSGVTVIDIGTGGGVPGIPLAIMRPTLHVTLLDSELRKIEFCQKAVAALSLHANAVCGRAEELAREETDRGSFDFAVSRAMASGSMLCELTFPLLRIGGQLIAMKGRNYDPVAERFAEACQALGGSIIADDSYTLCGEQKHLIRCKKTCETPDVYPRRFAKIKRSPL